MKIIIIGRTGMLYRTALALKVAGHEISGIITARAAPGYDRNENDFAELARQLKVPFFCQNDLLRSEVIHFLREAKADVGVSVNWVSLISEDSIQKFKLGILNAHMGDLPRYRGNACPNWAILNGEKEVVLSIHFMEDGKLDCGRVISQDHFPLKENIYIGDVYAWARTAIPEAFVNSIKKLEKDPSWLLKYVNVDDPNGSRCYPRCPEDGLINWLNSAENICRLVRASAEPFFGAYTHYCNKKITVWRARVIYDGEHYYAVPGQICKIDKNSGNVHVITGNGKIEISSIGDELGNVIRPTDAIFSIRERLE